MATSNFRFLSRLIHKSALCNGERLILAHYLLSACSAPPKNTRFGKAVEIAQRLLSNLAYIVDNDETGPSNE